MGGDLFQHGPPRQFMAKHQRRPVGVQHPGVKAFTQRRPRAGAYLVQQPRTGVGPADRRGVDGVAGGPRQPGQSAPHRLANAARQRGLSQRVRAGGEDLGDKERVAAGEPVQLIGVDPATGGQLRDRVAAERGQLDPSQRFNSRQVAPRHRHRMLRTDLIVAGGHHQQHRKRSRPPRQELQQVQAGPISPLRVIHRAHPGVAVSEQPQ